MRALFILFLTASLLNACGGDEGTNPQQENDTSDVESRDNPRDAVNESDASADSLVDAAIEAPLHPINMNCDPSTTISQAPFPANFRLGEEGRVSMPALASDPRFAESAKPEILEMLDGIIATRHGFGLANPVQFFVNTAIEMESATTHTLIVTLEGAEAGRVVTPRVEWAEQTQALAVSPAWGDYMMANSTYAVLLLEGLKSTEGEAISPHPNMAMLLGAESPEDAAYANAYVSFEGLRTWLASEDATLEPASILAATVFTTEDAMSYGTKVFEMLDAFPLEKLTRMIGWDQDNALMVEAPVIEGEGLKDYFGTPEAPFDINPGGWTQWRRDRASSQTSDGLPYAGGQFQTGIGKVINGSALGPAPTFAMVDGALQNVPMATNAQGEPSYSMKAMIPFTLYLCDSHLEEASNIPVAVFTHGGDSHRSAAVPWATLNCKLGIATLTYDTLFHGGRILPLADDTGEIVLPARPDESNEFTGLSIEDEGFVPDYAGDPAGGPETVGQVFALPLQLNPGIAEGNLIMMAGDTHIMTRYLKEGDWSDLHEGLSFDPERVVHEGLSYGTSFTTPVLALTQNYAAEVWSVGSGAMVTANLLTAPSNAELAAGFVRFTLGLATKADELMTSAWLDPVIGILQWLSQRGDPIAYAPYVLRHRTDNYELPILASGASWDHTLFAGAQMTFGKAMGFPIYSAGETWTLDPTQPGIEMVDVTPFAGDALSANISFGERTHTAAIFHSASSCHSMQVRPLCAIDHELQYPPIVTLESPLVEDGPGLVCELQHQSLAFLSSFMDPSREIEIIAPGGTCEALYSP